MESAMDISPAPPGMAGRTGGTPFSLNKRARDSNGDELLRMAESALRQRLSPTRSPHSPVCGGGMGMDCVTPVAGHVSDINTQSYLGVRWHVEKRNGERA